MWTKKALTYLYLSAPIAEALNNSELISVTKVVESFENPTVRTTEKTADDYRVVNKLYGCVKYFYTSVFCVKV